MSADLVEWLTGCLDHLEAVAVAASRSDATTWTASEHSHESTVRDEQGQVVVYDEGSPSDEQAAHIALHDPRAVLARVETERAVAREHGPYDERFVDCSSCGDVPQTPYPCPTLRLLAWGHRFDFPGYLDEWTPEVSRG